MCKVPKKRLGMINNICHNIKTCRKGDAKKKGQPKGAENFSHDGCGARQPVRYYLEDKITLSVEFDFEPQPGEDRKRHMTADEALNILRAISDPDCQVLGFDPRIIEGCQVV